MPPRTGDPRVALHDLLLLTRAPLACTAAGDGIAGFVLAGGALQDPRIGLAAGASAAAYLAGMALNDLFDRARDQAIAPHRPLPAGRITPRAAAALGISLLLIAIGLAALGGPRPAAIAALLALAILGYDALLKRLRVPGAFAMAACRALNILLGAALGLAAAPPPPAPPPPTPLPPAVLLAGASFIYVFSLTLLSTYEDEEAPRPLLLGLGLALLAAPLALLGTGARAFALPELAAAACALIVLALVGAALRDGLTQGTRKAGRGMTRRLLRGLLPLAAIPLCLAQELAAAALVLALFIPYIGGAALLLRPPGPPEG